MLKCKSLFTMVYVLKITIFILILITSSLAYPRVLEMSVPIDLTPTQRDLLQNHKPASFLEVQGSFVTTGLDHSVSSDFAACDSNCDEHQQAREYKVTCTRMGITSYTISAIPHFSTQSISIKLAVNTKLNRQGLFAMQSRAIEFANEACLNNLSNPSNVCISPDTELLTEVTFSTASSKSFPVTQNLDFNDFDKTYLRRPKQVTNEFAALANNHPKGVIMNVRFIAVTLEMVQNSNYSDQFFMCKERRGL